MKTNTILVLAISILVFIVACFGPRRLIKPEPESLIIGKTTYDEIIKMYGGPWDDYYKNINEAKIRVVTYWAPDTNEEPLIPQTSPLRWTTFYFSNNKLVGHESCSSYKIDHTNFDQSKINQIKKGKTTWKEVVRLMGEPHGRWSYPMIKTGVNGFIYIYSHKRKGVYHKQVIVSLDKDDIVKDYKFEYVGKE